MVKFSGNTFVILIFRVKLEKEGRFWHSGGHGGVHLRRAAGQRVMAMLANGGFEAVDHLRALAGGRPIPSD